MKITEIETNWVEKIKRFLPELSIKNVRSKIQMNGIIADLIFTGKIKGKEYQFIMEIKSNGAPGLISNAINQLKAINAEKKAYPIIMAPYISQRSAELCRQNNIGFIDLEGNAFLSFDNILIDKRLKERFNIEKKDIKEIFSPRATRVIRVLLENNDRQWLINDLADEAKISIGYTSIVLTFLVQQGYGEKQKRKGFRLKDKTALLEKWASVYDFSKNKIIGLYTLEKDFNGLLKKVADISESVKTQCGLTSFPAASLVAPYVARFSDIYLYIQNNIEFWREKLDLREVPSGANFYIIVPYDEGVFYGLRKINGIPIIGNIQLYLDLFKYPARGKEQAEYLRTQLIKF